MNCNEARRLLSACLDRDLTFAEDEDLRRHLRECPACSEEMTCLEKVQAMLRSLPETQPEPGFYESVCQRIAEEQAQPQPLGGRSRTSLGGFLKEAFGSSWLRPAVGVALGLVIGLLIQTNGGNDLASQTEIGPPGPAGAVAEGPLADLALPDSVAADPEYIHDPFVSGPQGRPVRVQMVVSRDHDAYITF